MGFRIRLERTDKHSNSKNKKPGQFSKRIIIFCIAAMMVYTGICLWMQVDKGMQPESTLTTVFFAAIFGELWELSKIKRKKQDTQTDEYNNEETGDE